MAKLFSGLWGFLSNRMILARAPAVHRHYEEIIGFPSGFASDHCEELLHYVLR